MEVLEEGLRGLSRDGLAQWGACGDEGSFVDVGGDGHGEWAVMQDVLQALLLSPSEQTVT